MATSTKLMHSPCKKKEKKRKKPENSSKVLTEVRVGGLSDANPVLAFASRIARGVPKGRDVPLSLLPAWCSSLQRRDKE